MKKKDPTSHRIIEKRRRDRMNNCLTDLSRLIPTHYMKKGRGRIEKTEIIEMSIRYLKDLIETTRVQHQQLANMTGSNSGNSSELESAGSNSTMGMDCFGTSSGGSNSGRSSSSSSISSASSSEIEKTSGTVNINYDHSIVDCFETNTNGISEDSSKSSSRNNVVVWYKKALLVRSISRSPPRR